MKRSLLRKYALLAVKVGVNVQKDQGVIISCSTEQRELAALLTEEAYKAGAGWVEVQWQDQNIEKLAQNYESLAQLSTVYKWQLAKEQWLVEENPAVIHLLSDDPDGLSGIDLEKMQQAYGAKKKKTKKYRDAKENKYQWTIIAAPSKAWAQKVFPQESASVAVQKLWQAIFKSVHLDDNSVPEKAWQKHNANFHARTKALNDYGFKALHYTSAKGTDLRVGLLPGGQWLGGAESTLSGVVFNPNMPTEEVFTSPLKGKAEGVVVATKPLSYQGQLIEDFSFSFQEGRVVSCKAAKGQQMLEEMINTDAGASYLGELALVPVDSPISQSGLLFYETLFDENASCHLALGRGFSMALPNYQNLSWQQVVDAGINDSLIHVDFMIGDETLKVEGIKEAGEKITIFKEGKWSF